MENEAQKAGVQKAKSRPKHAERSLTCVVQALEGMRLVVELNRVRLKLEPITTTCRHRV